MSRRSRIFTLLAALATNGLSVLALAQTTGDRSTSFQAVTGSAHEDVPGGNLLIAAYAIALVVLMLYVFYLAMMQRSSSAELVRIEALLAKKSASASGSEKKD